jgi:hypothetical protein
MTERNTVKPVSIWNLQEPRTGKVVVCQSRSCGARYIPMPKQSHRLCKRCKPPTQQCGHGVIVDFFHCDRCKAITGKDDQYVGLRTIKAAGTT